MVGSTVGTAGGGGYYGGGVSSVDHDLPRRLFFEYRVGRRCFRQLRGRRRKRCGLSGSSSDGRRRSTSRPIQSCSPRTSRRTPRRPTTTQSVKPVCIYVDIMIQQARSNRAARSLSTARSLAGAPTMVVELGLRRWLYRARAGLWATPTAAARTTNTYSRRSTSRTLTCPR